MLRILAITTPIYLCIALGYLCVRRSWFTKDDMRVLGKFVLLVALPALLFSALATRPLREVFHPAYLLAYLGGALAVIGLVLAYTRLVLRKPLTESAYIAMGMSCSNSGYVGYPVMLLCFGPLAGLVLAMNVLVENLVKLPLLLATADLGDPAHREHPLSHALRQTLARLVRQPMIVAILAGLPVSALGLPIPDVLLRTIGLFATATSGLALFIIGGNLVGLSLSGLRSQVAGVALGKLVLHPMMVLGAITLTPLLGLPVLTGELRQAAVLSAAMPMLGIYSLLAQRHGHQGFTAAALLVSTALSFVTLSTALWLLGLG